MKIKIGLFFGGKSVEHEVSVISAIQALNHFDREQYALIPVYISREGEFYTGPEAGTLEAYRDLKGLTGRLTRVTPARQGDRVVLLPWGKHGPKRKAISELDLAFPVVHGSNVEDGALQGFFRTLGLPFMGCDVAASAIGMDKYVQKLVFRAAGLPVLDALQLHISQPREEMEQEILEKIGLPAIIKPADLGSSVGIGLARDEGALSRALDEAFSFSATVLAERAVQNLRELNCAVLGDRWEAQASLVEEPVMQDEILSYEDKYVSGGKGGSKGMRGLKRLLPAPIPDSLRDSVQDYALRAFRALNCSGVARIDFLMDHESGEVWINEINTVPGSLAFYLFEGAGIPYPQLLDRLVKLALKRERERSSYQFEIETGILSGYTGGGKLGGKA